MGGRDIAKGELGKFITPLAVYKLFQWRSDAWIKKRHYGQLVGFSSTYHVTSLKYDVSNVRNKYIEHENITVKEYGI